MPEAQQPVLKRDARRMRSKATPAEAALWLYLRARRLGGWKFRRQVPLGQYILDFYCHEARLAVELDGGQHAEAAEAARDSERTTWLQSQGVRVLRFWNSEALASTQTVLEVIDLGLLTALQQPATNSPHPNPLPEGEGEVRKEASDA